MKKRFKWGCLIKIIIAIGIIGVIFLVFLQCGGESCIRTIDRTLPDVKKAPWEVTTPSHIYLAEDVKQHGDGVVMSGWYEQVNNKWVAREGEIKLTYEKYGEITVRRR